MSLQARVSVGDEGIVIHLTGELDMSTVATLREAVHAQLANSPGRLTLDLTELAFCDSLGLGTLVVLSRSARSHQTLLVLSHPSAFFRRMIEVAGVANALTIAAN